MTEEEWLACDNPHRMLAWLGNGTETVRTRWHGAVEARRWRVSERKLWLYAAAAGRDLADLCFTSAGHFMLDGLEEWAEGELPLLELRRRIETQVATELEIHEAGQRDALDLDDAEEGVGYLIDLCRRAGGPFTVTYQPFENRTRLTWILREIVGNPFRPVIIDPAWLAANDGAARHLAEHIAITRDFDDAGILADALEEAGCGDEVILGHLRGPDAQTACARRPPEPGDGIIERFIRLLGDQRTQGPHLRGCWVIDALRGRT